MGQKVNPISFRTGITLGWKSRWFASKQEFAGLLLEDKQVRDFIKKNPKSRAAGIDRIEIERTSVEVKVVLHVARPGLIIGKKGQDVETLQDELQNLIGRRVNLKIEEIGNPEIHAQLVAEDIAQQLSKRASFRRAMKRTMEQTMEAGAKGIKVQLAGRLGGAEMARREKQISGSIPLSTLQAKIDYGFTEAKTAQGHIGVQVWINQGLFTGDVSDGADAEAGEAPKKPKRSYKR
ncbi:MAG: 30S ribosomal protein S3 [Planctomycetaceae bacterium]|jgi:small subunit ribosomal protein S3|nr:30S ribosomal protein S3 [Planctomycetaceae bacterium]MCP4812883.1 30S ribosomal protein S3 [Planctomycetaceae bacterium]